MGCELSPNFPKREEQVNGKQSGLLGLHYPKHYVVLITNPVKYHDPSVAMCLTFLYFASSVIFTRVLMVNLHIFSNHKQLGYIEKNKEQV